ncbi:MAG: arginine--tRNA ligase, partial [Thermoplasmata archaeon]
SSAHPVPPRNSALAQGMHTGQHQTARERRKAMSQVVRLSPGIDAKKLEDFRKQALPALAKGLRSLGVKDVGAALDKLGLAPEGHGDFAFPAYVIAKELRTPPEELASELVELVQLGGAFERVEAEGPYLNIHIQQEALTEAVLSAALEEKALYGTESENGKRVILEHTSANPNGPFHVGRARNPIIGDTLARILRACGYDVETQYYVNDMGKQVATLVWGLENIRPEELPPVEREKPDHELVRYYQRASALMESDPRVEAEIGRLLHEYESGNEAVGERFRRACQRVLEGMQASLSRVNVVVDHFVWESQFVEDGTAQEVVEGLRRAPNAGEEDGALYLELSGYGSKGRDTRFFFTRSDGTTLYTTRDVAYHLYKLSHCDLAINVLGEDHKLEAKQLAIALQLLGLKKLPETVFYSFVSLPEGKMSTRRGRVVYLDDLIDEAVERAFEEVRKRRTDLPEERMREIAEFVGIGALRFNIIRIQPEKQIVFRWEEALNFEGNSAPFVQYAHARCCSILAKSDGYREWSAGVLTAPEEVALVRTLARFPEVVLEAGAQRRPHLLAAYAHECASGLNQFYKSCPVLRAETELLRNTRLALVDATRWVLRNSLGMLGIVAPEEM